MGQGHVVRVARMRRRLARAGHDLPVRTWDGRLLGPSDRGYRLVLHHPWSLRAMLVPPTDLKVGEAFLDDAFDVEGSMVAAIADISTIRDEVGVLDTAAVAAGLLRLPAPPRVSRRGRARLDGRRHSQDRDQAAVRHHYDVGVDFYRLFLDDRLVYSCAYFLDEDEDRNRPPDPAGDALNVAQARKLEVVCRKLGLQPGMRLLDIGCGWGSLILHAAQHHGVEALGVTLSPRQAEVAAKRIADAGLTSKATVAVQDYRDVTGRFDAVASVGMVEHVGQEHLAEYFRLAYERTAPGGRFLNHGITTGRRRDVRDFARHRGGFVGQYVFPDGALFPASRAVTEMEEAGFELVDVEQLRPNYARTLEYWAARLEARHSDAVAAADERTYRIWRAYMAGSAAGFTNGDLGVVQVLGTRGEVPLGRPWDPPPLAPPR